MDRISKDQYYLNIAKSICQRSTCLKKWYGSVIVKNDEVISTGYNGAPRGRVNCCELGYCTRKELNIPSGQRYELCLSGDTVIKLLDGTCKTIKELADNKITSFWVYSIDTNTSTIVPALAECARITGHATRMVEIDFDNGYFIRCTPEHKILLRDCTYKMAKDLKSGDSVMPMYTNYAINNGYDSFDDAWELSKTYNHKVTRVLEYKTDEDVYDLSVPTYENFAVMLPDESCVFVHNCRTFREQCYYFSQS